MGSFMVTYPAGGELDKVKYVEEIKNFAQFAQPYNKMEIMELPALEGVDFFMALPPYFSGTAPPHLRR